MDGWVGFRGGLGAVRRGSGNFFFPLGKRGGAGSLMVGLPSRMVIGWSGRLPVVALFFFFSPFVAFFFFFFSGRFRVFSGSRLRACPFPRQGHLSLFTFFFLDALVLAAWLYLSSLCV